ncbi:MAG: hypothetical protein GJ680_21070 [Alteromonadaceae bacterium]|nr:hypothetical protein [Alteromonadaceae bacterium]
MKMKSKLSLLASLVYASFAVCAEEATWWQDISLQTQSNGLSSEKSTKAVSVSYGRNIQVLSSQLDELLQTSGPFSLLVPTPDGKTAELQVREASIMAPELQQKFPQIRSFKVVDATGKNAGRFSIGENGLQGMYRYQDKWVYIDPVYVGNRNQLISYFRKDAKPLTNHDFMAPKLSLHLEKEMMRAQENAARATGDVLRTYRLAVATTGEYTQFHGGTVSGGLSAINAMVTRLNQVYEDDLAVNFELVAGNDQIIFTDAQSDPFINDSDDLDTNQGVIDGAIGNDAYDIGHVVSTGDGGVAYLGVVCASDSKAGGYTGSSSPTGDPFYIDYVAHEIGHQFGGEHTFNGEDGGCGGNRSSGNAYEPGSGSTIMSYASLCSSQNIQSYADPHFHIGSIDQIRRFIDNSTGGTCGETTVLSNTQPTVDAGADYTIPANTPFVLSGTASDPDGDTLSYHWEQYDPNGNASANASEMVDDGTRPLFRSWPASSETTRHLPRFSDVLDNSTVLGETYPTTSRTLNFRFTARDGKGGVNSDGMVITTVENTAGFSLVQPNSASPWNNSGNVLLIWNTADSQNGAVNCDTVDVELSRNSGDSFFVLQQGIANDGVAVLNLSQQSTGTANRLRLSCADNIFYAVNKADFTIQENTTSFTDSDGDGMSDEFENSNGLNANDPNDASLDTDQDGLSNLEEFLLSTNPNQADSDSDGNSDLDEVNAGTNPNDANNEVVTTTFTFEESETLTGWQLDVNNAWARTSAQANNGTMSLSSADVSDDQTSEVNYRGYFQAGTISFDVKVSSESGWDFLHFLVDGVTIQSWSGEQDWTRVEQAITTGEHKLTWRYEKDGSVSRGSDAAWIDDVTVTVDSSSASDGGTTEPDNEYLAYDFDGDGYADPAVRRPGELTNIIRYTSTNTASSVDFGIQEGDIPLMGDFDGDGKADIAVRRPTTQNWHIKRSSDGAIETVRFGLQAGDIPVPADYDGDGITDIAVRRPSASIWYIKNSSGSNYNSARKDGIQRIVFGTQSSDIPVPADYDGDGIADVAVRRPSTYTWYIKNSSGSNFNSSREDGIQRIVFGLRNDDIPVPADYDGDGIADVAVRRESNFTWYIKNSSASNFNSEKQDGIQRIIFGRAAGDIPTVADYDGDGKADVAVFRPSRQIWYVKNSSGSNFNSEKGDGVQRLQFGLQSGDVPFQAPITQKMDLLN